MAIPGVSHFVGALICNQGGGTAGIYSWGVPCVLGYNIILPRTPAGHMPFSFNSRYVLLTYAQSGDLSEWSVLDHISSLGAECIIGREDHADEGTHLHVFCDFGRKFRSRRQDAFDVDGCHPNIAPSRGRPQLGWDYAVKDGNVVAGGLSRPGSGGLPKVTNIWSEIVGAESRLEFLKLVQRLDPKSFVLRHRELLDYADRYFAEPIEPYVGPDGISFELGMVPELVGWREQSLGDDPIEGKCYLDRRARGTPTALRAACSLRSGVPAPCSRGRFFFTSKSGVDDIQC